MGFRRRRAVVAAAAGVGAAAGAETATGADAAAVAAAVAAGAALAVCRPSVVIVTATEIGIGIGIGARIGTRTGRAPKTTAHGDAAAAAAVRATAAMTSQPYTSPRPGITLLTRFLQRAQGVRGQAVVGPAEQAVEACRFAQVLKPSLPSPTLLFTLCSSQRF